MTINTTLKKLKPYLNDFQNTKLGMITNFTENNVSKLVVVMTVSDICKEYQGTEKEEEKVSQLLVDLVTLIFK